jgi:hypothetical protein
MRGADGEWHRLSAQTARAPRFGRREAILVEAVAALTGLHPMLDEQARKAGVGARLSPLEALRRAALGTLFGLHTLRFRIYLSPDHGLRQPE